MIAFSPLRWFWKADDGRVYSSAVSAIVPASDAAYAAFKAADGIATAWPCDDDGAQTDAALAETLNFYGLPVGTPTLPQLSADLAAAASAACLALTMQVVPDQVHQNAYVNAAAMVGPGAVVPTAEPTKSAFVALAASFGAEPAAFADMVVSIAAASWQLQAAQVIVAKAAAAAKTAADLTTALATFEATLAGIVTAITGSGVAVTSPAPIVIAGL